MCSWAQFVNISNSIFLYIQAPGRYKQQTSQLVKISILVLDQIRIELNYMYFGLSRVFL